MPYLISIHGIILPHSSLPYMVPPFKITHLSGSDLQERDSFSGPISLVGSMRKSPIESIGYYLMLEKPIDQIGLINSNQNQSLALSK